MTLGNDAAAALNPAADDDAAWAKIARHWSFAPGVTFLNHGSFGALPWPVFEARSQLLEELNRDPVHFFLRELQPRLASVRERLGRFLETHGDNLALVENATTAMNAIARSVRLAPGDEVLANDHEYGAVLRIWEQACAAVGARLVVQTLPDPLIDSTSCVEAVLAGASPRTRLLVVSHVTSPTAAILPVGEICQRARKLGIATCVDGPHALVVEPVDLDALDCDFYTASCHKWLLAPVGCGLLYVNPRVQEQIQPAIVSWGSSYGAAPSWRDEFNWSGTRDPSPPLAIPAGLDFLESVGIQAFRERAHYLAGLARERITRLTSLAPLLPDLRDWYGAMISLPLPPGEGQPLQAALWERFRIEVPVFDWQGHRLVRLSCQMYTTPDDIDRLVAALAELLDL